MPILKKLVWFVSGTVFFYGIKTRSNTNDTDTQKHRTVGYSTPAEQLREISTGKLPPTLLEAASWACPQLGPFVRQAVGVAVRRGLAHAVNATHVHVPPPPPPAAPVAVRPRLTPWMDAARAGGVVVRELQ